MQFSNLIGIFFIVLAFFVSNGTDNASFWDGCAGVSQAKSVFQLMAGYKDNAIQTQKNFLNQMIIVSQVKSIYHTINRDFKAARKTQKIFYDESVEPLLHCTPVIGHIKACIHLMLGDKDKGLDVLKDASRSMAIFVGAGLSGPVAAYMAGVLADAVLTSIDSYKAKRFIPYGYIDYLYNFRHTSFEDHFDMLADMAFIGEGGIIYSNYRIKQEKKSFTPHPDQFRSYYDMKQDFPDPPPKKWARKTLSGGISRSRRKKIKAKLSGLPISGKQRKPNKRKKQKF